MDPLLIAGGTLVLFLVLIGLWNGLIGSTPAIPEPTSARPTYTPDKYTSNRQSPEEKDASAGVIPMATPHRELLHKRGIYQLNDLKTYDRLVDISYVGTKRAETIADYLSAHVPEDQDWPKEIQSRI